MTNTAVYDQGETQALWLPFQGMKEENLSGRLYLELFGGAAAQFVS